MKLEPRKIELSTELGNDFIADVRQRYLVSDVIFIEIKIVKIPNS